MSKKEKATLRIIVDDIPPSNNEFLGNERSYRYYNSKKKKWRNKVCEALPRNLPLEPLKKAKVNIHYIFPDKRKRDLDNFSGKFLLDPLVERRILQDDCYQVLTKLHLSAEYRPKIKKSIIEVYELD